MSDISTTLSSSLPSCPSLASSADSLASSADSGDEASRDGDHQSPKEEVVTEVEVSVRAVANPTDEVRLTILNNATVQDVKEALAAKLGRPELLKRTRLVMRIGGARGTAAGYTGLLDAELINHRRNFLLMGVENLLPRATGTVEEAREHFPDTTKAAAQKVAAAAPPAPKRTPKESGAQLTLQGAKAMQRDLIKGFSTDEFQNSLRELCAKHEDPNGRKFKMERQKLFLSVQSTVLPQHGLEGSAKGVFLMMEQMNRVGAFADQEFIDLGNQLNTLLGLWDLEDQLAKAAQGVSPAQLKAREEAERKAREEATAKLQATEEAARKAKEEAEQKAKEEAKQQANEVALRRAREEAERHAKEEAERKAKEEEEAERKRAERKARGSINVKIWEIVGGEDKGGVLIRDGCALSSAKLPDRLSTGAFVLELDFHDSPATGQRIHFRRLTGTGPDGGWISVSLNHKELAVPAANPPALVLGRGRMVAQDLAAQRQQ
jgi:hypothetical protein